VSSGKENLGPGVREIVEALEHGRTTIDLREVKKGDKLYIKIGDREEDHLDFEIIEPAPPNPHGADESALAWLPGWKWSSEFKDRKRVKVYIAGSCTYNPGASLGFTMLSLGRITQGRSLAIWCGEEGNKDKMLCFRNTISAMALIHVE